MSDNAREVFGKGTENYFEYNLKPIALLGTPEMNGKNNQLILDAIEKIVLLRGVESGSTPVKNRLRQVCVRDLLFRDKALIPVGRWIRV